jgi:hypothetical protein
MRVDHKSLVAAMTVRHATEVEAATELDARRDQKLKDLTREHRELLAAVASDFAEELSPALAARITNVSLGALRSEVTAAYKTRDRAMAAVWRIDELHNVTLSDKCKCGKPVNGCREYQALSFFRDSFYTWERKQIDLLRKEKMHGLPADHPESRKHYTNSWSWLGAPATDRDERRRA